MGGGRRGNQNTHPVAVSFDSFNKTLEEPHARTHTSCPMRGFSRTARGAPISSLMNGTLLPHKE